MESLSTLVFLLLAKSAPLFADQAGEPNSRSIWAPSPLYNIDIGHPSVDSQQNGDVSHVSHITHLSTKFSQINISKDLEITISRLEQILTGRLNLGEHLPGSPSEPIHLNPPSHLATVSDSTDELIDAIDSVGRNNTYDVTNRYTKDSRGDLVNIMPTRRSETISRVNKTPSESLHSPENPTSSYPELVDMNTSSPIALITNANTEEPVTSTTDAQDRLLDVEEASPTSSSPTSSSPTSSSPTSSTPTSPASTVPETQALTIPKSTTSKVQLVSPCPGVFSYIKSTPGKERWGGQFFVEANETKFDLDIELNKAAHFLGAWVGEVSSYDNIRYTIKVRSGNNQPGSPIVVKIFVKYSSEETDPPTLKSIRLNGRQICPTVIVTPPPKIPTDQPTVSSPSEKEVTSNFGDRIPEDTEFVDGVACGRIEVQATPFITHGVRTARGQWPWHAGIYQSDGADFRFICGGSLIGIKTVLTAAHCITGDLGNPMNPESLTVFLGKHLLRLFAEGEIQTKQVSEVHMNPEYKQKNYQSDIAILILSQPVQFTPYVRPVCLWNRNRVQLSDIEGQEGVVVGWGYNEHGMVSEELQVAKLPVISQQTCLWSNPQFYTKYGSDTTYCAGYKNGTSVCNGDSGGGMVFPKTRAKGSKEPQTWALRGIVSLGVTFPEKRGCATDHYSVFTDVAKFYNWVRNYI